MSSDHRMGSIDVVDGSDVVHRRPLVSWSGALAGMFTVVALLALFAQIGMAIGMSSFASGDRAAPYLVGAGVYGLVSAIVAFLAGGYVSTMVARHAASPIGVAQGALVWAICVPVLAVLAAWFSIGTVTAAGVTTIAAVQADPAAAAEARDAARAAVASGTTAPAAIRPEFNRDASASATVEMASKAAGVAGFAAVLAMLLSLGAAMAGGFLAARAVCGTHRLYARGMPAPRDVVVHT